ncbi:hypothetical protein [Phytomonospora endophytica]|uniref:Cysteine synthase n=1 Tax=Phytomonospora endophytica TaxID=714109 RepID=A0A841FQ79_9ACTN|nr:hypothetical protein [Phytomonospora endophytica]MBB6035417.1 cysteine synthase [Phytomonospora endophytica]GIG63831.1 hypothetical protein Pen01_01260 [Phytomonospora endophytica]
MIVSGDARPMCGVVAKSSTAGPEGGLLRLLRDDSALDLVVIGAARGDLAGLARRLRDAGTRVRSLTVRPADGEVIDLRDVDFAVVTPLLRTLRITRARINGSVFGHPTLTRLSLDRVVYDGPREIALGDGIEWVRVRGSMLPPESFTVGPGSALRAFRWEEDAVPAMRGRRLHLVSEN